MLKTFDEHGNPDHKKSYKVQKKLSNKNRERLKKTHESCLLCYKAIEI